MVRRDELGILIVEPSDTYQRILTTVLNKLGFFRLTKVHNRMKAQVLLQHDKSINVILAELMIPEPPNGLDFVKQVRTRFSSEELPILMMTNLSEKRYVQEAIQAGINGYLIKPIDPDHLEAHLWRLFDLPLRGSQKMGEFLVQEGLISTDQRDIGIRFQKQFAVPISTIALQLGYVRIRDLKDWALFEDDDQAFFDHLGEMGMTKAQEAHLRDLVANRRLRLGDILVEHDFVKKEELERALVRFRSRG